MNRSPAEMSNGNGAPRDVSADIVALRQRLGVVSPSAVLKAATATTAPAAADSAGRDDVHAESGAEPTEQEDPQSKNKRAFREWYGKIRSLPIDKFLIKAWECDHENRKSREEHDGWKGLFDFARFVRGHPQVQPHLNNPNQIFDEIEKYLRSWTRGKRQRKEEPPFQSSSGDPWEEWFEMARSEARTSFVYSWEKARYTILDDPLEQAINDARANPLTLPPEIARKRPVDPPDEHSESDYAFFVSIAGHLQVVVGNHVIKLPCHTLNDRLSVSHQTISRWCNFAIKDKFLKLVKRGEYRSKVKGIAAEYRFDTGRWEYLSERAESGTQASFRDAQCLSCAPEKGIDQSRAT